jgi:hypothetical protein
LRKSLPVSITCRVFPAPSCTNFRVSGLILRSLIHFELILVQGDKNGSNFSFLQMDNHFSQHHLLLKRLTFLQCMFLALLSNIWCAQLCEFISGSSILFHWSSCLFLCQYHTVFIVVALQYSLKSGIVISPALLFLLSIALASCRPLCFQMNFKVDFSISVMKLLEFR